MQAIPMPDAQGTAGFAGAVGFSQLVLRSSATGRPYPTADRRGCLLDQLPVGPGAQGVVDGREGQPERHERRDGVNLLVVISHVAQLADVVLCDDDGVPSDATRPAHQGSLALLRAVVPALQNGGAQLGRRRVGEPAAPGERAEGVTEG